MSSDIRRNDTGLFTAEGMVAGPRAARMAKYREEQKAAYEKVCGTSAPPFLHTPLLPTTIILRLVSVRPLTHTHITTEQRSCEAEECNHQCQEHGLQVCGTLLSV